MGTPGRSSPHRRLPTLRLRGRTVPTGAVLLVLVAYVPLLFTKPGKVGADTKTYLYLDPGRLISRAASMWDPNIGLGTVTHQNIGYLWPMGPYYLLMEALGVPDWVAQRLWLGTIIAAAGMGVRWMLRELRWDRGGVTVASFAYALSPFLLHYGARISVILLPFAGLPWLIGLASRSLRSGGWRAPALFALVTLTVGGVNATSLLLVMVAPVLWVLHATFVEREVSWRRMLAAGARISALTLITSFWWVAGLLVQGTYGIPILRYTETYYVVANAALAPELLRGLGYWFFYGRDALGAWIQPAETMVQNVAALALSYLLPILAFASGLLTRFRHRGYFAAVTVIGLLIGVGAHPWDSSAPAGALFKAWTRSDAGLAFRSTPRAVPLIALGLAVFLGAGVAAVSRWRPSWHLPVAASLLVLILLNQAALFRGQMVDRNLLRDEELPQYWLEAAADLDAGDHHTRVYEIPGTDFASYRWGNTVDPITPGLIDRDFAARELIPYGTPPSADLLNSLDVPLQQGTWDPDTLAPMARMMGIGTIVHRADLQYERFRTPRPRILEEQLRRADGLTGPTAYGEAQPNEADSRLPLDDEVELGTSDEAPDPAPVSVFEVSDPRPMLRTVQASDPVVVAGDGDAMVALASAGRLQADRPFFYAASFGDDPDGLRRILDEPGSELVVTDTNRRQARRWGSVRENDGYTETAGELALVRDPADNRLEVFPGASDDAFTVTEVRGPARARASDYGNPVSYTPSGRAMLAVDGDDSTAWRVGAFEDVRGEYIQIDLDEPLTADRIGILQAQPGGNRWITEVTLSFDGSEPLRVALTDASRIPPGQEISFPERTFSSVRMTIESTNLGELPRYVGVSEVGIAEITLPGVAASTEVIRPPTQLLDSLGQSSLDRPLSYLFTRRAANPSEVVVDDEEQRMSRVLENPAARSYIPYGKVRLSGRIPGEQVDSLIGLPSAAQGGATVTASAALAGSPRSRPSAAVDGSDATAWRTPVNGSVGSWIQVSYPQPITVNRLPVTFVADGRHSVPTQLSLSVDGGPPVEVDLGTPSLGEGRDRGATDTVEVTLDRPLTGTTFRFTVDAVTENPSKDWFSGARTTTSVGIAELGLPAVPAPADDTALPGGCRGDLIEVDGRPVPVRLVGDVGDALDRRLVRFEACDGPVELPAGRSLLQTASGETTGWDVDLLALSSAAGGGPGTDTLADPPGPGPEPPSTETSREGRLHYRAEVTDAEEPYWVVLGQSLSPGWHASIGGEDLGPPTLVNGFANGWLIDPATHGTDATIELRWTPQRVVWIAIWASAFGVLICVALVIRPPRFGTGSPVPEPEVVRIDPVGISPTATDGPALSAPTAAGLAVVAGALTWLAMGPWVGLAAGVLTGVALGLRKGQVVLRAASVGALTAAAAFIVAKQARGGFVVDFDWMNKFEVTHAWALLATALLALDALVEALRRRSGSAGSVERIGAGGEQHQGAGIDPVREEELGVGDP